MFSSSASGQVCMLYCFWVLGTYAKYELDRIKLSHGVQSLKPRSPQRQHLGIKVELKPVENDTHTPSRRDRLERQNPVVTKKALEASRRGAESRKESLEALHRAVRVFGGSLRARLRGIRAVLKAQNLFVEARHSIS